MNRGTILLLGVVAQIVLTALFLWRVVPSIANDIDRRSELALSARNLNWAQVSVDGRDVTLTGLAPSEKQHQRALDALSDVAGVRVIDDQTGFVVAAAVATRPTSVVGDLPVPDAEAVREAANETGNQNIDLTRIGLAYVFRVERSREQIVLRGMVPDEPARVRLLDSTRAKFAGMRVDDELLISDAAPPDFMLAAEQAISVAGLVSTGAAGVRDMALFVEGLTASDRDLARLNDTIMSALPNGYDLQLQVGSRQTLSAMMRENPDLAQRVGKLPDQDPGARRIDLGIVPALDRSPQAAARCQSAINERLASETITFDTGSSDISQRSTTLVDDLVTLVKSCPDARIEIAGHTDDQGTESNNLSLSQRRAESVMEYFVRNGVKLGRLAAVGYGEGQPLVENKTAADRARNRRIEFRVL
ncbi:MAG: OmpA family protein [Gammaproteobacteria bacterium]